jgi:tetratricopeptide (TPR) repeat protein
LKKYLSLFCAVQILLFAAIENSYAQKAKPKKNTTESAGKLTEAKLREAEFYFTEGQKYFMLEDYSKALGLFYRSLEVDPSNATVHYKIAEILSRSQKETDLIKAADHIDRAIALQKKNKYFYLLGGSVNASLLRFDKSIGMYETMLVEIPGTEDYLFELAVLYLYRDKPDEAIKVYNRAEQFFGVNEISSVQKQSIYLQQKKLPEAFREAEKLLEAFPDEEKYQMAYAEMLATNKQINTAITRLEKYTKSHPEAGNAKFLLAGFYRDAGKESSARELILEIIDNPEIAFNSKLLVLRTYSDTVENNLRKGISDIETEIFVIEIFDQLQNTYADETGLYIIGGDLYLNMGKIKDARILYRKALSLDDSNYPVWQNLLAIDAQLNQIDSLMFNADKALELFPNQGTFYYFNGYALNRKKKYAEAIATLNMGKRLAENDKNLFVEINSLLGDTYNATKDYAKSDAAYDAALETDPNNSYVLNNYSYYLALRKEDLEKAEKMATKLTKDHPNNPYFLDTHAWVLFASGKYKEARKIMEKVIESGQASATHHEHYGDILFKLGEVDNAVKQWKKAKELNSTNSLIDKKIADRKLYE